MKTIEEYKIKSISEFLSSIKSNTNGLHKIFRGQSNKDWELIPSIFRMETFLAGSFIPNWSHLEHLLISDFKRRHMQFYHGGIIESEIDMMCLAQHIGIPTRFLDWSENPLIALFFAIEDLNLKSDPCIWQLNYYNEHISPITELKLCNNLVYKPNLIDRRIANQKGCFTIHQLPEDLNDFNPFEIIESFETANMIKYIVPRKYKPFLKMELSNIGIDYLTIYPDIYGLGKNSIWAIKKRNIKILDIMTSKPNNK